MIQSIREDYSSKERNLQNGKKRRYKGKKGKNNALKRSIKG